MKLTRLLTFFILSICLTPFYGCDPDGDTDCELFGDCDGGGGGGGGGSYCSNSCTYAYDGECDDGGSGSVTSLCDCGTDCADCGTRYDCGGGGGGGGSTSMMIWTSTDFGCGGIAVYIDGNYAGTVTHYSTSGTPGCGASGYVTQSVAPGVHSMSASCGSYTWGPSNYSVSSGSCYKIELN